jgi:hypothetical protein
MTIAFPNNVKNDSQGYEFLISLYYKTRSCKNESIVLDFISTEWFEGNMVALLGAIIDVLKEKSNTIQAINLSNEIQEIFKRNHFLSILGGEIEDDFFHTTVEYKKFARSEGKSFREYVDTELLSKQGMPRMSKELRKKISENIFEIFDNAIIHGNCQNIFSCGQYYPSTSRLDFTIVDLGITIKKNVNTLLGMGLSGKDAIAWAVEEGNTTKKGNIPGGLGLNLIREFLKLNGGKIQIVSDNGYWDEGGDKTYSEDLSCIFIGAIVNLEFRLDDTKSYLLLSEVDKDDIF